MSFDITECHNRTVPKLSQSPPSTQQGHGICTTADSQNGRSGLEVTPAGSGDRFELAASVLASVLHQRLEDSHASAFRQENPFENGPCTKRQENPPNRLDGRKPLLIGDDEPAVPLVRPF